MNDNDKFIFELKEKIANKERDIKSVRKFSPHTNCSLLLEGQRYNLHTLYYNQLAYLLVKLSILKDKADDLQLTDYLVIEGYNIILWISDIDSKMENLNVQNEVKKLKEMKERLTKLLSTDVKISLELEELSKLLGEEDE